MISKIPRKLSKRFFGTKNYILPTPEQHTSSLVSAGTAAAADKKINRFPNLNIQTCLWSTEFFSYYLWQLLIDTFFDWGQILNFRFKRSLRTLSDEHLWFEIEVKDQRRKNYLCKKQAQLFSRAMFCSKSCSSNWQSILRKENVWAVLSGQNIKSQTKPSVLLRRGQASKSIFALEVGHLSLMQPKQRGACHFDIYYVNFHF